MKKEIVSDPEVLVAEVVFNVGHYNKEYGGAASLADIGFELNEEDEYVHNQVSEGWKEGKEVAEEGLKTAERLGYIRKCQCGGWVITPKGERFVNRNKDKLGHTFESKHHKGEMEDES